MFEVGSKAQEVLICLQQEDRRSRRKDGEGENLPIGFEVLKVRRAVVQKKKKIMSPLKTTAIILGLLLPHCIQVEVNRSSRVQRVVEQAASSVYMDSRSVTLRSTLGPGRYVVLPTTFLPGVPGRFLLRVFSHSHVWLR